MHAGVSAVSWESARRHSHASLCHQTCHWLYLCHVIQSFTIYLSPIATCTRQQQIEYGQDFIYFLIMITWVLKFIETDGICKGLWTSGLVFLFQLGLFNMICKLPCFWIFRSFSIIYSELIMSMWINLRAHHMDFRKNTLWNEFLLSKLLGLIESCLNFLVLGLSIYLSIWCSNL
jgi:hypothetical protein